MNTQNNSQQVVNNRNVLQGQVSGISRGSVTYGNFNQQQGMIRTDNTYSFRVGNIPVSFQTRQNFNMNDGDNITAVGDYKNGTFHITALRNETTGAIFKPTTGLLFVAGALSFFLGLIGMFIIIGFIILPFSFYFFYAGFKCSKAVSLLHSIPKYSHNNLIVEQTKTVENISPGDRLMSSSNDATTTENVMKEIERIFEMKSNGSISEEEYALLKSNILKR